MSRPPNPRPLNLTKSQIVQPARYDFTAPRRPGTPAPTVLAPRPSDPTPGNIFAKRVLFAVLCGVCIYGIAQVTFWALTAGGR
jgi:hypothetical protein